MFGASHLATPYTPGCDDFEVDFTVSEVSDTVWPGPCVYQLGERYDTRDSFTGADGVMGGLMRRIQEYVSRELGLKFEWETSSFDLKGVTVPFWSWKGMRKLAALEGTLSEHWDGCQFWMPEREPLSRDEIRWLLKVWEDGDVDSYSKTLSELQVLGTLEN